MQFLIYRVLLLTTKSGACSSNKSGVVGPEQTSDSKTMSAASDKYRATQPQPQNNCFSSQCSGLNKNTWSERLLEFDNAFILYTAAE